MDPFTIALLGAGAIKTVAGIFSSNRQERIRRERIKSLYDRANADEARQLTEGRGVLSKYTQGLQKNEGARAERLARSQGRENLAKTYALPQVATIASKGNEAIGRFELATRNRFSSRREQIADLESGEPIAPGVADWIGGAADIATNYLGAKQMQKSDEEMLAMDEARATPGIQDEALLGMDIPRVNVQPYSGSVYSPQEGLNLQSKAFSRGVGGTDWFAGLRRRNANRLLPR